MSSQESTTKEPGAYWGVEREWERGERVVCPLAEADQLVQRGLPGRRVLDIQPLHGGKANTNFALTFDDGQRVVLRFHTRDASSMGLERAVANLLKDRIPIAQTLYQSEEEGISIQNLLPGERFEDVLARGDGADAAADAGAKLAAIHSIPFASAGFLDSALTVKTAFSTPADGYLDYLADRLDTALCRERLGPDLHQKTNQFIAQNRSTIEALRDPVLTHGDFKPPNLLVQGSKITGVLDWEFVHSGLALLDIAIFLRHEASYPTGFTSAFESGYLDAGGTLPDDWWRTANILDLVSLVDFLARPVSGPNTVRDCLTLIIQTLAR